MTLTELLSNAKHAVVLTGAGISTLSGIPDFRGAGGLCTPEALARNREKVVEFYNIRRRELLGCSPNAGHEAIRRLEDHFDVDVITQNIDLLHQKAGSRKVLELHGSPLLHHCLRCGKSWTFEEIAPRVRAGEIPVCDKCGGIVKPDIVFFGEGLPEYALTEAEREARAADLMLVLGTSLTVYPAAAVPEITLQSGGKIAIINRDPTHLDRYAVWTARDLKQEMESLEL